MQFPRFVPLAAILACGTLAACDGSGTGVDDVQSHDIPVADDPSHDNPVADDAPALDTPATDAGPDAPGPGPVEQPTPEGRILVAVQWWGGASGGEAYVTADFHDKPMRMDAFAAYPPGLHRTVVRGGDCVLYGASDAACNPVCNWDAWCDASNTCVPAPSRQAAGRLTLNAGATEISADPSDGEPMPDYYYLDPFPAGSVAAGTTFRARAAGGDFPAFDLQAAGLDPLDFSLDEASNTLKLEDGRDNEVTWETAGAQGTVQMVVNVGWHGSPPQAVLYCEAPATAGRLFIPRAVVEALPVIGGPSLMPHGSFIAVNRTVVARVEDRDIEFTLSHRAGLNPTHNAPEW